MVKIKKGKSKIVEILNQKEIEAIHDKDESEKDSKKWWYYEGLKFAYDFAARMVKRYYED